MKKIILTLCLIIMTTVKAMAFPELTGGVVDEANILSDQTKTSIEQMFEQSDTYNFVVATVKSLEGKSIEQYATELGNHWGIGERRYNNGVILLIAPNERLVRIATGLGMETILSDSAANAIIQTQMMPYLKKNDFNAAVTIGAQAILMHLQGAQYSDNSSISIILTLSLLTVFIGIGFYIFSAPTEERGARFKKVIIVIGSLAIFALTLFALILKYCNLKGHSSGGDRFSGGGRFGGGGSTGKF